MFDGKEVQIRVEGDGYSEVYKYQSIKMASSLHLIYYYIM